METLEKMLQDAVWVAKALFDRNKVSGSSANLSFRFDNRIYITGSGTCFGRLRADSFSVIDLEGQHLSGIAPSKEVPLHLMLYGKDPAIKAVVHTHSFYSTLWSCLENMDPDNAIPAITPYLRMKVGSIALIPYAKPGSELLFHLVRERLNAGDGFLLRNHGPVICGKNIMDAFYGLEELEESARIAWSLRGLPETDYSRL